MPTRITCLLVLLLLCFGPSTARAGAAGGDTLACEATAQLKFVHDDDGDGVRDPGENDPCTSPLVDSSGVDPVITDGASGPVCIAATVGQLRGVLSLVADDDARDNQLEIGGQNTGAVLTLVLEVRHGDQLFVIADAYTASQLGDLIVGNWDNRLSRESLIFSVDFNGALFLTPRELGGETVQGGAFDGIGAKLTAIAEQLGVVTDANAVLPIIAKASRDGARKRFDQSDPTACPTPPDFGTPPGCGEGEVQEDGSLASVARYRLTISFAEKLTATPPTCS